MRGRFSFKVANVRSAPICFIPVYTDRRESPYSVFKLT